MALLPIFSRSMVRCCAVYPVQSNSSLSIRFLSSRKDCIVNPSPRCSEGEINKTDCAKNKNKKDEKKSTNPMALNPECCINPCPDILPRFDELFYKASDKAKRKYSITWPICPEAKIAPKVICNYEKIKHPPFKKRTFPKPKTARAVGDVACNKKKDGKCPKFTLAGCKNMRTPPKCIVIRKPIDCKKICAPYPSFSECKRSEGNKRPPIECLCLQPPSLCEVWTAYRLKTLAKK